MTSTFVFVPLRIPTTIFRSSTRLVAPPQPVTPSRSRPGGVVFAHRMYPVFVFACGAAMAGRLSESRKRNESSRVEGREFCRVEGCPRPRGGWKRAGRMELEGILPAGGAVLFPQLVVFLPLSCILGLQGLGMRGERCLNLGR